MLSRYSGGTVWELHPASLLLPFLEADLNVFFIENHAIYLLLIIMLMAAIVNIISPDFVK